MVFTLLLLLSACDLGKDFSDFAKGLRQSNNPDPTLGAKLVMGGIAADAPRAVQAGRAVLIEGGNAVDAAAAMYFALAVTLPSSASLGGGGVCLVHDGFSGKTEAIDFLARSPKSISATAERPSAVPGNVRGFFALHAKYGRLRWARIVAPAEKLARFGFPVSRALAKDIAKMEEALAAEPSVRSVFAGTSRTGMLKEGDTLTQLDLTSVLGRLRSLGPVDFYSGATARKLVQAVNEAGGSLSFKDLSGFKPKWLPTLFVPFKGMKTHFSPPPAAAGVVAAEMWSMLTLDKRYEDAEPEEKNHLIAEAAYRAFASREQWMRDDGSSSVDVNKLATPPRSEKMMSGYRSGGHTPIKPKPGGRPENPSATSLAVIDEDGYGIACALTMNNLFGAGRVAEGTGILIAAAPGKGGRGPASLGPVLLTDDQRIYFAGAASGGVAAPTALVSILARTQIGEMPLEEAMAVKRVHHSGAPDVVYYEQGLKNSEIRNLAKRGHRLAATKALGRVNAVSCFEGVPDEVKECAARTDPRGYGMAVNVGF